MSLYLGTSPIADSGNAKANTSLSNLTNTGKNIANWSNNVTNCITEIPQDIKLELNNGTLTLKAGSKVYVPNGSGVFDSIIVASDVSIGTTSMSTTTYICSYCTLSNQIDYTLVNDCTSGTTYSGATFGLFYNTTANTCQRTDNGGSDWRTESFPFCIIKTTNGIGVTSIDKVFNGFGYIGSTVFALPGVKGLIPNGRNEDGSLKNIEFTTSSVLSETYPSGHTFNSLWFSLNATSLSAINGVDCTYNEEQNILYNVSTAVSKVICATGADSNGKITSFTPKTVFHAVDYNDFNDLTINVLKAIYPVGAVYIGTTSTCPLASFFGTWTLKGSGIVTSVNTNVPIKGNGKNLGLTNGSVNVGLRIDDATGNYYMFSTTGYGVAVSPNLSGNRVDTRGMMGITTDASKSGIVGTVTRSVYTVNIWERTA